MNKKRKGTSAERELIHLFWKNGYAAMRAAGSGSTSFPCPDIIAGNRLRKLAIECKSTKELKKYLSNADIKQLKDFCDIFGAEAWIGIRFDVLKWYFITIEDLKKTPNGFVINIQEAQGKGLLFEEMIGDNI